ncbi:MAG: aldolase, partial [Planctomycetota bacterium]
MLLMFLDVVSESKLVAILRLESLDQADRLVDTLLDAGVRCIEFTLTNRKAPA